MFSSKLCIHSYRRTWEPEAAKCFKRWTNFRRQRPQNLAIAIHFLVAVLSFHSFSFRHHVATGKMSYFNMFLSVLWAKVASLLLINCLTQHNKQSYIQIISFCSYIITPFVWLSIFHLYGFIRHAFRWFRWL